MIMGRSTRIHIVHVGSVGNKGTYALLKSEICEIKKICGDTVEISVSTDDVETLKRLEPQFGVHPSLVDIPYVRADIALRRRGQQRSGLSYKLSIVFYTMLMPFQAFLAMTSAVLIRRGVEIPYRAETIQQIRRADAVISTADENFKEGSLYIPINVYWMLTWWTVLFSRMTETFCAKILEKPVVVFPNSIGPFRTPVGRLFAKVILQNVDLVMLRELYSYRLFKQLSIQTPHVLTTDVVLLLEYPERRRDLTAPGCVVGVCPALYTSSFSKEERRRYVLAHSMTLDWLVREQSYQVVFLPHEISSVKLDDDLGLSRAIMDKMKHHDRAEIVEIQSIEEFNRCISQLDFLITSRMHPAVLACANRVPAVMVVYDHKQAGFFDQLDLSDYAVNIKQITKAQLMNKVSLLLCQKDKVRKQLDQRVPILQEDLRRKLRAAITHFVHGSARQ